ncbi:GNAT family N-acetyltransferase [Subsaxibacter sp. CAU 1640]|uniref:GNAT family N-acetyltransferase n=1 Tax=Subsaxibacter sp. CAU 1640 TaxID=2933271 RepID=UPI00200460C0|nr:GNAT family N-acetyltransferase [Subsaxibacter sp. CAU 1640]MCK7590565.1 GNAT family N-acetyltransferase [Subsaxibacter sp. CAU 1640]
MIRLSRTGSSNIDFVDLVKRLDTDLKVRDGEEHDFYHQFNAIVNIKHCIVAYQNEIAVGCGAIKKFDENSMEVKRMYVLPEFRGQKIAVEILSELEQWAKELGFNRCILETGKKQPEAIALYSKSGYQIIPNYGQYEGVENSVCFEKILTT